MGMAVRRARKRSETGDPAKSHARAIGQRLYMLRARHKLSTTEAGKKLGWSHSVISKWERGETIPGADALISISQVYGVSIDWLLRPESENTVAMISADQVAVLCRAAAGKPDHPLWGETFAVSLADTMLPLHGAATVQSFRDAMRRVRERGRPDDVRDALAWVATVLER